MGKVALEAVIKEKEQELAKVEETFKAEVEDLQSRYTELQKEKEMSLKRVKESGLGLMKSVKAARTKTDKSEL
jgi:hypothetical protein